MSSFYRISAEVSYCYREVQAGITSVSPGYYIGIYRKVQEEIPAPNPDIIYDLRSFESPKYKDYIDIDKVVIAAG